MNEIDLSFQKAKQIHHQSIVFDGHCDTILEIINKRSHLDKKTETGQVDIPKMRDGGTNVQFFAVFIENYYKPERSLKRTF